MTYYISEACVETQEHDGVWSQQWMTYGSGCESASPPEDIHLPDPDEYIRLAKGRYDYLTRHTPGRQIVTATRWRAL